MRLPTQKQTLDWVRERFPTRCDPDSRALKLGEEAGEVQGAVIKMGEGRKTLADLATETAQLVICAMALAESAGFDLNAAIEAEWERCGVRVWTNGAAEEPETSIRVEDLMAALEKSLAPFRDKSGGESTQRGGADG